MKRKDLRLAEWILAALALVMAMPAQAQAPSQDYPSKPVTFITPAAAGNSPDVVTRIVADKLTQLWKQQIVVDRKSTRLNSSH